MSAYPLFFDGRAICTDHELLRRRSEVGETGNGEIFVIEVGIFAQDFIRLRAAMSQDVF